MLDPATKKKRCKHLGPTQARHRFQVTGSETLCGGNAEVVWKKAIKRKKNGVVHERTKKTVRFVGFGNEGRIGGAIGDPKGGEDRKGKRVGQERSRNWHGENSSFKPHRGGEIRLPLGR